LAPIIRIRTTRTGPNLAASEIEIQASRSRSHLEELGEAEGRGGGRRAGGDVLAVAAIGLLLRHRVEHLVRPDPNQITRQRNHTPERDEARRSRDCKQRSVRKAKGRGAHRAAGSGDWARLAWLGHGERAV